MIKFVPFIAVLFFSCNSSKELVNNSFIIIHESSYGGQDTKGHLHIKDNETYIQLIESLKIDESQYNELANVNFKTNDVIVLFQGQKNTGGYSITIDSIQVLETSILRIKLKEKTPEKGANVTMALTSPYCIALIPKTKQVLIE